VDVITITQMWEAVQSLLQWALGLLAASIFGIISMHVRISVLSQRLIDHIKNYDDCRRTCHEEIANLWDAIDSSRDKRR
jgi:hypothetical protein